MAESPQGSTPAGAGMPLFIGIPTDASRKEARLCRGTNKADYELCL